MMRRLLAVVVVLALAFAGFYVAWPAWTGRQIRNAIEANDPDALARKIDFERVRARAKPLIAAEMQRSLDQIQQQAGPLGAAIASQLKAALGERLAGAAIDAVLTPENLIRVARQGKDLTRILKDIAREGAEKADGPTTPGAPATPTSPDASGPAPQTPPRGRMSRENIKSYRIAGPLSLEIGLAHEVKATDPDVIAELAFTDGDWKVVGILPRL